MPGKWGRLFSRSFLFVFHSPLLALPPYSTIMGNSQSQPTKSTPLDCLLQNPKTLGFQGEIGLSGQKKELLTIDNFCGCYGKWSEIPYVQAFFAFRSWPSLCTSCSTSQIFLAHSGPHPPNTVSPDPCSDFSSSSFDPSDHSAPQMASNPVVANPVSQPPP